MSLLDQAQHFGQLRHGVDLLPGAVALAQRRDLLGGLAEQEEVLLTHLLADLDVGAIECADRQCAVHAELHVPCAGSLQAGGGDLLGEIGGRIHPLTQLDVVVGQEDHPQAPLHVGIGIDRFGDAVEEADDQLGHVVAGRRLAAEYHRARRQMLAGAVLDAQVAGDHPEGVEVLALVFVDPLHLHVEHRGGIHQHTGVAVDVLGEVMLHRQLGGAPALQEAIVIDVALEAAQLVEIAHPALTHRLIQQGRQLRIGQGHPTPGRDAIGDIDELLRPQGREVREQIAAHQFAVQRCHAVDMMGRHRGQIGHAHALVALFVDD